MIKTGHKFGVRIYILDPKTMLIKQTVRKPRSPRYVVDTLQDGTHREAHIKLDDTHSIAGAVRLALRGTLKSK